MVPRGNLWMTGANLSIQPKMPTEFHIGTHEKSCHEKSIADICKITWAQGQPREPSMYHMVCFHRVSLKALSKVA